MHKLSFGYSGTKATAYYGVNYPENLAITRVPGEPVEIPQLPFTPVDIVNAGISKEESFGGVDTISTADEVLTVMIGLRQQRVQSFDYGYLIGIRDESSDYSKSKLTKSFSAVVKPKSWVSIYANYIEGLEQGFKVGQEAGRDEQGNVIRYGNAGQVFPPYATEQYEGGIKFDFERVGAIISVYQIARPNVITQLTDDPLMVLLNTNGEQRNRGVDFSVFGAPLDWMRLFGSFSIIDAKLRKTDGGLFDGNRAPGLPKYGFVARAEVDVPSVPGLTLTGTVTAKSSMFTEQDNFQRLRAWTVADLGFRYKLPIETSVEIRGEVTNIFDKQYWATSERGYLGYGDVRTFRLSAMVDF